jgi:hypothetical protein
MLVDGRNRREACRRAGIVPDHVLLDGQDPIAYIASANINRRHLTVGQRAMLMAVLYPDPEKGGKGRNSLLSKEFNVARLEFSGSRLSQARTVLRYAPDLLDPVRSGAMALNAAYEQARIRKGRAETHESRFERLKAVAPDLAELVVDGQLQLEEAEGAYRERQGGSTTRRFFSLRRCMIWPNSVTHFTAIPHALCYPDGYYVHPL